MQGIIWGEKYWQTNTNWKIHFTLVIIKTMLMLDPPKHKGKKIRDQITRVVALK